MATKAGQKITDIKELGTLKESDIARIGGDIFRRDLAKEQEFAKSIDPASKDFNKFVYARSVNQASNIPHLADIAKIGTGPKITPGTTQEDTVIGADTMGADQDLTLPAVGEDVDTGADIVGGAEETIAAGEAKIKELQDYADSLTLEKTETQEQRDEIGEAMSDLLGQQANKATDQLDAEEARNLPQLKADYASLNTQIRTRLAEYNSLKVDIENRPITMSSIIGQQAQVEKKKLAEIGLLQARASGLAGEIDTAQAQADRAIDLKYSTQETTLKIYQAQLDLLKDTIGEERQVLLTAQQAMLDAEKQRVQDLKDNEKTVQNIALQALANGADSSLVGQIQRANDAVSATQIAGDLAFKNGWSYVATPAERDRLIAQGYEITQSGGRTYVRQPQLEDKKTSVQTVGGRKVLIDTQTGETIKDLGSSKTPGSGTGTTKGFKFSSDDKGRLLAVDFTNDEITQIQSDINEFGIETTLQGMPENQVKAIRDIAGGVTPTQAGKGKIGEFLTDDFINDDFLDGITAEAEDLFPREDFNKVLDLKSTEDKKHQAAIDKHVQAELKKLRDKRDRLRTAGFSDEDINKQLD